MADLNNLEISENFDTIKTLLNSIRAQGVLNTSDVDKLLSGINSKLEKINTEEDIDLIKIFLSELKQNLDERHSVLLSKFGAIESLFSNLLKNSSEALKSSEIKELFDIVATNLSVFSREVVAQKETLTDITLRIDAMRSDDSQKKDIIKNVSLLKNDIDRLTNGFDSIVLSLNENFKTIIKTISGLDTSENFAKFGKDIEEVINSANTILSALQMLDKKNIQIEDAIKGLATQDDLASTKKWLSDLAKHEQNLTQAIEGLSDKYYKIDNLADKIDASVDILAGLKTAISERDENNTVSILDKLSSFEQNLANLSENNELDELKQLIDTNTAKTINLISENRGLDELKELIDTNTARTIDLISENKNLDELKQLIATNTAKTIDLISENKNLDELKQLIAINTAKTIDLISENKNLDELKQLIATNTAKTIDLISETKDLDELKQLIDINTARTVNLISDKRDLDELKQLVDINTTRTLNEISSNTDNFLDKLTHSSSLISELCEKSFSEIEVGLGSIKDVLTQIDENNISANNVIFSNISDRLAVFESDLRKSLEKQGDDVANSSAHLMEEIAAIKNLSGVLDYKFDSSIIEIGDAKNEFSSLKNAVENVLALDFVNKVKDLKVDLYAVKQDITEAFEASSTELSDSLTNELFGKYELLVSKLDSVETEIKQAQTLALNGFKTVLENISASIVDILSYVSSNDEKDSAYIESQLNDIKRIVSDNNLSYVENVRDVVEVILSQVENNLKNNSEVLRQDVKASYDKLLEVQNGFVDIKESIEDSNSFVADGINNVISAADSIKSDFDNKLNTLKNALLEKVTNFQQELTCDNADKISELKFSSETLFQKGLQNSQDIKDELKGDIAKLVGALKLNVEELMEQFASTSLKIEGSSSEIVNSFDELTASVNSLSTETKNALTSTLSKILDNFVALKALLASFNDKNADDLKNSVEIIISEFAKLRSDVETVDSNIDEDFTRQLSIIESNFEKVNRNVVALFEQSENVLGAKLDNGISYLEGTLRNIIVDNLAAYKNQVETLFNNISEKNNAQSGFINEKVLELNNVLNNTLANQNQLASNTLKVITEDLRKVLSEKVDLASSDYEALRARVESFATEVKNSNNLIVQTFKNQLVELEEVFKTDLNSQIQDLDSRVLQISESIKGVLLRSADLQNDFTQKITILSNELTDLNDNVTSGYDEKSALIMNRLTEINTESQKLSESINTVANNINLIEKENSDRAELLRQVISSNIVEETEDLYDKISNSFALLSAKLDKDEVSRVSVFQTQLKELGDKFNLLIEDAKSVTKSEVSSISETLMQNSREAMEEVECSIEDKVNSILAVTADISAGELQTMESFANRIIEQVEVSKQTAVTCKDLINDFIKSHVNVLNENIEKETDVIVKDLIEQMNMMREFEKDELSKLTVHVENTIEDYIYEHINDLKSYLDIKMDSSVLDAKLDGITSDLVRSASDILSASNKLLEVSVFENAMDDMKKTNEIIVSSMTDNLNRQLQGFIEKNISKNIEDKFILFDKKFTDIVVDKYEEVKLISTGYNNSFETIEASIKGLLSEFSATKSELSNSLLSILDNINNGIDDLGASFADLMKEIMNKSFDEAFQASVNNQIQNLEGLVRKQFGYLEDISDLCCNNLPELTEMNTIVKYNVMQSVSDLHTKLEAQEVNIQAELDSLKTDVITQFLNIFNQISFVTEQEEILDFIQEKHSELITVLSHIVTTMDDVKNFKDIVSVVDNKVDNLKDDIDLINEKITSIISSDGNIDYVYSLHDLESDIANLRICLNGIKENNDIEEFKKGFDSLSEDIISISTRINKLILSSDESGNALQENLREFKLVINDLDERTRNFAQESGLDRMDNKLGAINAMIKNGVKTNQVFNQVFEYLAEWVDNAGAQITAISDKVETLDDIGQIKVMLEDLKADAVDNSESTELIEALGTVFDKQARKIASLEAKLDRMIVETTINNKNNKLDIAPLEDTLNRFLVAIDDKMSSQQLKINSLETKLQDVMSLIDPKDTAQLTKKVGGMDRQIAKLNKSIEKIASHVIEK